ncbi:hypothetical protein ACHHYP_20269 [Achlya hypogyna]|uniref:Tc1-like transposase DDE domain-containing protein n=1 Tax=Achlya hypogyna TaxID=1202772 RepID=A0A1V9YTU0_ACHHY|nr:hypothetical protein ACHHYP_20269 [Achlya hypogyna]
MRLSWSIGELLLLAKRHRQPSDYVCVELAAHSGHKLLYTPPYHPELQPIEVVWAVAKNRIAANPATTLQELDAKLKALFDLISTSTWVGAFKNVRHFEDKYLVKKGHSQVTGSEDVCSSFFSARGELKNRLVHA